MATYPSGYSAANAISMVRNRTGATAGVPGDPTIQTFLNAGIENVERTLGAIYANASLAISSGADSIALPADLQSIINLNFSITIPTTSNAIVYPIQLMQEGMFERIAGYIPGQSAGYPTIAFIQTDASNVMTLQIYPIVNVNGYINVYYVQRPQLWTDTTTSTTQLDSMVQEAVICWACRATCENRGMFGPPVQYFQKLYDDAIAQIKEDYALRNRPGRMVVADVTELQIGVPPWVGINWS